MAKKKAPKQKPDLATYKFDTSEYIPIKMGVPRKSASGRLVITPTKSEKPKSPPDK